MTGGEAPTGQLTYTSVDVAGAGSGGWQVAQSTPDMTVDEERLALRWVSTDVSPPIPGSRFPGVAEIAALPRRLVSVVPAGTDAALLVHSVPAGPDASGRPGNVFNHVLLDRQAAVRWRGHAPDRPVQWWRAPGWLTPYGADQVRAATVDPAAPPGPGTAVTREAVSDFLLAEPGRLPGLQLLLDAVTLGLREDQAVAVVADDQDEGVQWLAAVAFLAAPQAARVLSFSTYERGRDLSTRGCPTRLALVLRADAGRLEARRDLLVVDPTAPVQEQGDGARGHRVAAGLTVPVSAWSELAGAVLSGGRALLVDRLLAVDELSELEPDAAEAVPWWPLAVAVAEHADLESAWPAATRVLLRDKPVGVPLHPDTDALLADLLDRAEGQGAEEEVGDLLAGLLAQAQPDPGLVARLAARQARLALQEPGAEVPASAPPAMPAWAVEPVRAAVRPIAEEALRRLAADDAPTERWLADALRRLQVLAAWGLPLDGPAAPPGAAEVVDRLAETVLDPAAESVLRADSATPPALRHAVGAALRPFLLQVARVPGDRLPHAVLLWLRAGYEGDLPTAATLISDPVLADLVVRVATAGAPAAVRYRAAAAAVLLDSPLFEPGDVAPAVRTERALAQVAGAAEWTAGELERLVALHGRRPELDFAPVICATLLRTPPGPETWSLAYATRLVAASRVDPLTPAQERILALGDALLPDWHRQPVQEWAGYARLLVAGVRCWRDPRVAAAASWLPATLLVAAVRAVVWAAAGHRVSPGRRLGEELAGVAPDLDLLVGPGAEDALVLLAEPFPGQEAFLDDLERVLARLESGQGESLRGPLDPRLLVTSVPEPVRARYGASTLGAAVFAAAGRRARRAGPGADPAPPAASAPAARGKSDAGPDRLARTLSPYRSAGVSPRATGSETPWPS